MHSSATTFGCDSGGERSVASASPTVCVVCSPAPTSRKANAAAAWPMTIGPLVSPDRISSANGMIASPPNCTIVPIHRYGTRRQPSTERWVSDRKPTTARNGANTSGRAIMHRDQPGRHAELDDHHPVQRADHQHHRHPHRHLEQRQAQQAAERQRVGCGVRERQQAWAQPAPFAGQAAVQPGDRAAHRQLAREASPHPLPQAGEGEGRPRRRTHDPARGPTFTLRSRARGRGFISNPARMDRRDAKAVRAHPRTISCAHEM